MVISCSAYGCTNKWSRETSVHFHKFPFRSEKMCKKWISAMKRKNFVPTRASLVCSDHFRQEDYIVKPGMQKQRLKSHAVPSIFNFPVEDYVPVKLIKKRYSTPLQPNSKWRRKNRCEKRGRKRKSCIEQLSVTKLVEDFDEYDDTVSVELIEETEIYESDNSNCISNDNRIDEENEDDASAYAEEEDKCRLLGSMWGERLKLLPLDVRIIVRKMIDKVFDEAQTGSLTEDYVIVKNT